MITNYTREQSAILVGSRMLYFAVGPGSQTLTAYMKTLTGSEFLRVSLTGSPNFTIPQQVSFQSDLNSVQASGLVLSQFGNFSSATINTGSVYLINQLNGSLVCDGTLELSFETSFKVE